MCFWFIHNWGKWEQYTINTVRRGPENGQKRTCLRCGEDAIRYVGVVTRQFHFYIRLLPNSVWEVYKSLAWPGLWYISLGRIFIGVGITKE